MRWLDVCGPPGVGKSTICDALWGPHAIEPGDVPPPPEWHDFCNEITRLFGVIQDHPSFVAAVRMNRRSLRKMAVVHGMYVQKPYIQTGFVQRGLGFGWRLQALGKPVEELYHFWRLMPVSLGVAFLDAPVAEIERRNHARERVAETAHENRAFMVELMQPAIAYAKEVLEDRGIFFRSFTTDARDAEAIRADIVGMADAAARDTAPLGSGHKIPVLSPPPWW